MWLGLQTVLSLEIEVSVIQNALHREVHMLQWAHANRNFNRLLHVHNVAGK